MDYLTNLDDIDVSSEETVISEIMKIYPDKELSYISVDYRNFYMRLRNYLKEKDVEIGDFFRGNGFIYSERRTVSEDETLEGALYEVEDEFGYGLEKVSDISENNPRLYRKLLRFGKVLGKTTAELLNSNGFNLGVCQVSCRIFL